MGKRTGQIFYKRRHVNNCLNRRKHFYLISNQKTVNEINVLETFKMCIFFDSVIQFLVI